MSDVIPIDRRTRNTLADGYDGAATELAAWSDLAARVDSLTDLEAQAFAKAVALLRTRAAAIRKGAKL